MQLARKELGSGLPSQAWSMAPPPPSLQSPCLHAASQPSRSVYVCLLVYLVVAIWEVTHVQGVLSLSQSNVALNSMMVIDCIFLQVMSQIDVSLWKALFLPHFQVFLFLSSFHGHLLFLNLTQDQLCHLHMHLSLL